MRTTKTLNPEEIQQVQSIINYLSPGIYEAPQILGALWERIPDPYGFGRRFLQTVLCGLLAQVHYHDRTTANHRRYAVGFDDANYFPTVS